MTGILWVTTNIWTMTGVSKIQFSGPIKCTIIRRNRYKVFIFDFHELLVSKCFYAYQYHDRSQHDSFLWVSLTGHSMTAF